MRLFGWPDGLVDKRDAALWLSMPFDLGYEIGSFGGASVTAALMDVSVTAATFGVGVTAEVAVQGVTGVAANG